MNSGTKVIVFRTLKVTSLFCCFFLTFLLMNEEIPQQPTVDRPYLKLNDDTGV